MTWQTNHFASLSGIKVAADNGTLGGYVNATDLQGPAGPGINFRGAWAASTAYAVNDLVTYGGSAYIAPAAFTSGSSFNSANWLVFAAAGAAGSSVTYGTTAGTAAQGNDSRIVNALQSTNNLSDVGNAATARTNLGVTAMATLATAAQGSVVYYGASGPTVLAPGTSGYVLQTAGAGANPSWVAPSTGGISLPSGTAGQLLWNNAGTLAPVTVSGATFSSGTLTITTTGGGSTAAQLADGVSITANSNGTLSVALTPVGSLTDISTVGPVIATDVVDVNRGGTDYKTTTKAMRKGGAAAVALAYASSIATDATQGGLFTVTLTGNATLANPTNLVAGESYAWEITQDGTGGRTLSFGSVFSWPGGTAPTLSAAAGAVDVIAGVYNGTRLRCAAGKAFA